MMSGECGVLKGTANINMTNPEAWAINAGRAKSCAPPVAALGCHWWVRTESSSLRLPWGTPGPRWASAKNEGVTGDGRLPSARVNPEAGAVTPPHVLPRAPGHATQTLDRLAGLRNRFGTAGVRGARVNAFVPSTQCAQRWQRQNADRNS